VAERAKRPLLETLPFDSARQWNAVRLADGRRLVKGAPERVLALCAGSPTSWSAEVESLARRGQRVIALAEGAADPGLALDAPGQPPPTMLGLIGLADPPRPEAIAAVAQCQAAGIRVIMITGDHAHTARAIAERFGLLDRGEVIEGSEIDRLDPELLAQRLDRIAVVARATPEHKLRLVQALQAKGAVVAMTGDGVNDAPALKQASIGVAMGKSGTEAAKEAAVMVLADDNFATLAHAVEEGRAVYDAIVKSLAYILPTNAAQALILILAVLVGFPLPITPVQILWVNLVTSVTLGMALAFAPGEPDLMRRPPRHPQAPLLTRAVIGTMGWTTVLMTALSTVLFLVEMGRSGDLALARTLAVNGLVAAEIGYLFAIRSFTRPAWTIDRRPGSEAAWIAVAAMIALQIGFTHLGAMAAFFDTRPMGVRHWLLAAGAGVVVLVLVELEKALRRGRRGTSSGGR
jgi:magnesium-transporting ATPase (P-type)